MADPTSSRWNSKVAQVLMAVVVLGLQGKPGTAQGPPPAAVGVVSVMRRTFQPRVPVLGTVHGSRTSKVTSEVGGLVSKVAVEVGDRVNGGADLFTLDRELLEARLQAAVAEEEASTETVNELKAGSRPEDIEEAKARVEEAEARHVEAKDILQRLESLVSGNSVAETEVIQARAAVGATLAIRKQREALLKKLERGPRKEEIRRAEANLRLKQAAKNLIEKELLKTAITAPFSGVVSKRDVEEGQYIRPGDAALEIVALDPIRVTLTVPEAAVSLLGKQEKVEIRLDAMPGETFDATLEAVVPTADPQARTFPVRLLISNPDHRILPGMLVRAQINLAPLNDQLALPKDALVKTITGDQVFVVRGGKAVPVPVTVRFEEDGVIAVSSDGLSEGEDVVSRGNDRLRPGQDVTVVMDEQQKKPSEPR